MEDFLQYTSGKQVFSLSQGTLEMMRVGARVGAGVGAGAQASKTVLRILCKSFSEYLNTFVVVIGATAMRGFISKGPTGYSDNLSPNLKDEEESEKVTKGATEG